MFGVGDEARGRVGVGIVVGGAVVVEVDRGVGTGGEHGWGEVGGGRRGEDRAFGVAGSVGQGCGWRGRGLGIGIDGGFVFALAVRVRGGRWGGCGVGVVVVVKQSSGGGAGPGGVLRRAAGGCGGVV